MNKIKVLPAAGLLALELAGPVSAGTVSNSSGSALEAQGYADQFNDDGSYTSASVNAWQDNTGTYIDLYSIDAAAPVSCGDTTPDDPKGGFWDSSYHALYGSGLGSLALGSGYGSAAASATMDVSVEDHTACTDTYDQSTLSGVTVTLNLTANGSKIMERGTASFKIPGTVNAKSSFSTTYRTAAGSIDFGQGAIAVDGAIGKVTWRDHLNAK